MTEDRSFHVVAPGCSRGFSIEHQPIQKENNMIISWLHKLVNPNITNTLVIIRIIGAGVSLFKVLLLINLIKLIKLIKLSASVERADGGVA